MLKVLLVNIAIEEYTGEELEALSTADISKSFPAKVTVTVVADHTIDDKLDEGQVFFSCSGLADTTIIYSGYLNDEHLAQIGENPLGKRFTIEGIFGGYSTHNTYTKRLNLYPVTITEKERIEVEEVQLTADLTTLKIDQKAELSVKILPADAFGTATIEVKSGSDFVTVDGTTVTGKAAGTAVLVAKVGDVVSADLTFTVLDEVYVPDTIANVKSTAKVNDNVYIKARYVSTMKNTNVYGSYFADGKDGLLVYGFDGSKLNANETYLITGKVDIYNGAFQVKEATVVATEEYTVTDPVVTEVSDLTTLKGVNGGDTIKVSGTVAKDITADKYGNTHFDLTVNGTTVEVRADARYESSLYTEALNGVKAGTAVELVAHVSFYNSNGMPTDSTGLQLQKIESLTLDGTVVGEEEPDPVPVGDALVITADKLGLGAYANGTGTVDGVGIEWVELGSFGNGIQLRKNSQIWNTTALSKTIKNIEIVCNADKDTYTNAEWFDISFGTEMKPATSVVKWGTEKGVKEYVITPTVTDATYFFINKIKSDYSYYFDEIVINFNSAE